MGSVERDLDYFLEEKKHLRNPLVPVAALMTAGVLTAWLVCFGRGNSLSGRMLMRGRVVFEGATVSPMVGTASYYGGNPWKR